MTYSHSIVTGVPGIVLIALGLQIKNPPWQVVGYVLLAVGVLLFVYSIAILLVCLAHETASILARLKEAEAITPELLLLRARSAILDNARGLDEQAKRIVLDNISLLGVAYTLYDDEPLVAGTSVPYWFLYEWLDRCDEVFLAPVGEWSEGRDRQDFARQLVRFFIARGQARAAAGNQPARWSAPEIYRQLRDFRSSPTE